MEILLAELTMRRYHREPEGKTYVNCLSVPMLNPTTSLTATWVRGTLTPSILVFALLFCSPIPVAAQSDFRDQSDVEKITVFGSSLALFGIGRLAVNRLPAESQHSDYRPPFIDEWFRRKHTGTHSRHSNFLDNRRGSVATPFVALTTMAILDANRHEFSRDIPYFLAGVMATKGITDIAKGLVRRPRPYTIADCCDPTNLLPDDQYHQHSFFSGHSSGAFFTATFFNSRMRRHMRRNWTREEYRTWRWTVPAVSFGWASFVAMSRIHADKHYFTDVAAGALAGYAFGELFYRFAYSPSGSEPSTETPGSPLIFVWTISLD